MGWLKSLFGGGGDQNAQIIENYKIATSGARTAYENAVNAAKPVEQRYSDAFRTGYVNLGGEQARQTAAQRYATALAPAYMRTAAGRAQAARAGAETAGQYAAQEAANRLGLEQAELALGQSNWANKMQYAGLTGSANQAAQNYAGALTGMEQFGQQQKQARRDQLMGLGTSSVGALAGPAVAGFGGSIASSLGVGINSNPKTSGISRPDISGSRYQPKWAGGGVGIYAAGGRTTGNAIVGDGGNAPELVLNPTGAPITVVPLTNRTQSRWVNARSFLPQPKQEVANPYKFIPGYACGGRTTAPVMVVGEGRRR